MPSPKRIRQPRHGALTPELLEQFCSHLERGLWNANAAELIGVHPVTVDVWLAKGRTELEDATEQMDRTGKMPALGRYGVFAARVMATKARVQAQMLGVVVEVASMRTAPVVDESGVVVEPGRLIDPAAALKAATWYLERADNRRYGKGALRVDLNVGPDAPSEDEDPVDVMMERLDAIAVNIDARKDDPASPSPAHE